MAVEGPPSSSPCIAVDHDNVRVKKDKKHSNMIVSERGQQGRNIRRDVKQYNSL